MSVTVKQIIDLIEIDIPLIAAEDWDNVGLQVGVPDAPVEKVLVCLELNDAVIEQAITTHCQLIIAHHPLIFKPLKSLREDQPKGRLISRLIRQNMAFYAMHTNYDHYDRGLSYLLAKALLLEKIEPLIAVKPQIDQRFTLGKKGQLTVPMTAAQFAEHLKKSLSLNSVRLAGDLTKTIATVAVIAGAGMDFLAETAQSGVDAFVTGDAKYHEVVEGLHHGLLLADVGHFESEVLFAEGFAKQLTNMIKQHRLDVSVVAATVERSPFHYL